MLIGKTSLFPKVLLRYKGSWTPDTAENILLFEVSVTAYCFIYFIIKSKGIN